VPQTLIFFNCDGRWTPEHGALGEALILADLERERGPFRQPLLQLGYEMALARAQSVKTRVI
jgi:hypothetical protein